MRKTETISKGRAGFVSVVSNYRTIFEPIWNSNNAKNIDYHCEIPVERGSGGRTLCAFSLLRGGKARCRFKGRSSWGW
jgi:hypothetical protein